MTRRLQLTLFALAAAIGCLAAGGCATVQPWERAKLANPCMVFDANGQQVAFDNHWQSSREGAAGGFGMQGGGCGCR
jgi:hypothetical protein